MKIIDYIWSILILLTSFAFLLGYFKLISSFFVTILLISTFIKGQLVIEHFMGLKETRFRYRIIPTLWLLLILSLIATAYYLPHGTY